MGRVIFSIDLARDLGFASDCPAFWRWCARRGLRPLQGYSRAFDPDDVAAALDLVRV